MATVKFRNLKLIFYTLVPFQTSLKEEMECKHENKSTKFCGDCGARTPTAPRTKSIREILDAKMDKAPGDLMYQKIQTRTVYSIEFSQLQANGGYTQNNPITRPTYQMSKLLELCGLVHYISPAYPVMEQLLIELIKRDITNPVCDRKFAFYNNCSSGVVIPPTTKVELTPIDGEREPICNDQLAPLADINDALYYSKFKNRLYLIHEIEPMLRYAEAWYKLNIRQHRTIVGPVVIYKLDAAIDLLLELYDERERLAPLRKLLLQKDIIAPPSYDELVLH